jgi:hypothetical protein
VVLHTGHLPFSRTRSHMVLYSTTTFPALRTGVLLGRHAMMGFPDPTGFPTCSELICHPLQSDTKFNHNKSNSKDPLSCVSAPASSCPCSEWPARRGADDDSGRAPARRMGAANERVAGRRDILGTVWRNSVSMML